MLELVAVFSVGNLIATIAHAVRAARWTGRVDERLRSLEREVHKNGAG